MILPVQITYRNLEESPEMAAWIQQEAAKLDQYYGRITSCRVLVEIPHAHREWGRAYNVRIDLRVPREELVVKYETTLRARTRRPIDKRDKREAKRLKEEVPHKDPHLAIRNAFRLAKRQLQDYSRKQREPVS